MKIFQIITLSELGGAQSVVINLANRLANEHQVFVISGGNGAMWEQLDKRIKQIKIKSLRYGISLLDGFVWIKLLWIGLIYRPHIVHLHSSKIGALGRVAFPKKKIVYTVHGFDSLRVAFRHFLPLERTLQKYARAIVGVSKYDEKNLLNEGITNNIKTIYNGIADKSTETDLKLVENIKCLENCEYAFKIMCIARLAPPKNVELFFKVAETLPDIAFFWVGNQYLPINIPKNVYFLGEVPNAALLNKYVDLSILPSDYEGLPISIIEALCFSTPVVASRVGGISEILNGENGFAVDNTVESFKEKILFYKNNREEYEKACIAARKSYENKFTVDKMVDGYVEIYNQIIE